MRYTEESAHGPADTGPAPDHTLIAKDDPDMAKPQRNTSPAFQIYPKEFLSSTKVIAMSMAERGVYITLLFMQWLDGGLPTDLRVLAKLVGLPPKQFLRMWPHNLARCFKLKNGAFVNERLEKERKKQLDYREKQRNAAAMRWDKLATPKPDAKTQATDGLGNAFHIPFASPSPSPERTKNEREIARASEPFDSFEPSIDQQPDGQAWFTFLRDSYPSERVTDNRETVDAFMHELGPAAEWPERFQLMLATLTEHKASEQWQVPKFAPNLITWLKRGDWRGTRKLAKAGRVERPERRSWLDECGDLAHEPSCNSDGAHQLRKQVAAKGCTHPGVCQSFGEHQQRVATERRTA